MAFWVVSLVRADMAAVKVVLSAVGIESIVKETRLELGLLALMMK